MKKLHSLILASVVAIVACESGPVDPNRQPELDHIPVLPGDDARWGHLKVCKFGTAANFELTIGAVTTPFSLAAGECDNVIEQTTPGTIDFTVTELASATYALLGITRTVTDVALGADVIDNPAGPSVTDFIRGDRGVILEFTNEPIRGDDGCTPGYWKNHAGPDSHSRGGQRRASSWQGYDPNDSFDATFGVASSFGGTLIQALIRGGGGENALGRHAVAALLNAAHGTVIFFYTEAEVIGIVQDAYSSGDFGAAKDLLATQNEMGCPL